MLDVETIQKTTTIYENLSPESRLVVDEYKKVLGLTEEQAKALITNNVTATAWIWNRNYLVLRGMEHSVEMLIKCTLFRKDNGMYNITEEEKERILTHYGFDINEVK